MAGVWADKKSENVIDFAYFSSYNRYLVSVGHRMGINMFEMQKGFRHLNPNSFMSMVPANLQSCASNFFRAKRDVFNWLFRNIKENNPLLRCLQVLLMRSPFSVKSSDLIFLKSDFCTAKISRTLRIWLFDFKSSYSFTIIWVFFNQILNKDLLK